MLTTVRNSPDNGTVSGSITSAGNFGTSNYGTLVSTTPTAGSYVDFECSSYAIAVVTITGTWSGNLNLEATSDDTNWFTYTALTPGNNISAPIFTTTTATVWRVNVSGLSKIRVRALNGVTITSISVHFRGSFTTGFVSNSDTCRVIGSVSEGGASSDNPLVVGGKDPSNKVRALPVGPQGVAALNTAESVLSGTISGLAGSRLGKITTVATTTLVVRNSTFNEQTSGAQRGIKSSSILDTSLGTGARTVRITYYTLASGTISGPFTEDKTLNGTTVVTTSATNICYVESIEILTVGSGGASAGTISLYADTLGVTTIMAGINAGESITNFAHHYIPSGSSCLVTGYMVSSSSTTGNVPLFDLTYRDPTNSAVVRKSIFGNFRVQGSTGTKQMLFTVPKVVNGPAILEARVTPESATSQVNECEFMWVEV